MSSSSPRGAGAAGLGLTFGTAAAAGLHAPQWVWIATAVAAVACVAVGIWLYFKHREDNQRAGIRAGHAIRAGGDIRADDHIEAGWGIDAGGSIQAGRDTTGLHDDLARLHSRGSSIRDELRPRFGFELVGTLTDRVRKWDGAVRERLDRDAPLALLTYNEDPFPEPVVTRLLAQADPADRLRLVEFMDHKLEALAAIISDARASKS